MKLIGIRKVISRCTLNLNHNHNYLQIFDNLIDKVVVPNEKNLKKLSLLKATNNSDVPPYEDIHKEVSTNFTTCNAKVVEEFITDKIKNEIKIQLEEYCKKFAKKTELSRIQECLNSLYNEDCKLVQSEISNDKVSYEDEINKVFDLFDFPDKEVSENDDCCMDQIDNNLSEYLKMKKLEVRINSIENKVDRILQKLKDVSRQENIAYEKYRDSHNNHKSNFIEATHHDFNEKHRQLTYKNIDNIKDSESLNKTKKKHPDDSNYCEFDDIFYENRQFNMNNLVYKKSIRSLVLNERPFNSHLVSNPPLSKEKQNEVEKPVFVNTK